MKSITEKAKFCKWVVEYAIKENNNAKAARWYQTTRQQVKRWRDKYDRIVKSLVYKSKRPKSPPINIQGKKWDNLSKIFVFIIKNGILMINCLL